MCTLDMGVTDGVCGCNTGGATQAALHRRRYPLLLQTRMYRHVETYFSMMRRKACCAFLLILSASEITTTA